MTWRAWRSATSGASKRRWSVERALVDAAAKIATALGVEAFGGDAHALLISIYKDPSLPNRIASRCGEGGDQLREAASLNSRCDRIDGQFSLSALIEQSMTVPGSTIDVTPASPSSASRCQRTPPVLRLLRACRRGFSSS